MPFFKSTRQNSREEKTTLLCALKQRKAIPLAGVKKQIYAI
jgi:hypothetical protein